MTIAHLKKSRLVKAIVDRPGNSLDFAAAEARLAAIRVAIVLGVSHANTAAGQAAALTAAATSVKCFGGAALVMQGSRELIKPLPIGKTIDVAAATLGASVAATIPDGTTHTVIIGDGETAASAPFIRCWWNGWLAGVVPRWDERAAGASGNPLSGVFGGALAVREIFGTALGLPRAGARVSIASLWTPWADAESAGAGPVEAYLPSKLWFVGLGHLGQGFLWNLGLLPAAGSHAVLQDDQKAGIENEATGLLTTATDINQRKTRIAARWLDELGWETSLIERRHFGDIPLLDADPAIVVTGLDSPDARLAIAKAGFDFMVDAGLGHGPVDFEGLQIRVLKKGADLEDMWSAPPKPKDVDGLLDEKAYKAHAAQGDGCGTFDLAEASVAVPFVGAAAGALAIAQVIRLGSMLESVRIMQMDLASPEMVMAGGFNEPPEASVGGVLLGM
jgi:hypothetical protein